MQLVKGLNKYGMHPVIKKLASYRFIEENSALLKKNHIQPVYKNEYQLQATLVYLRSMLNKEAMFGIYLLNVNENGELWNAMSYQQRQILLHGELMTDLAHLPHFKIEDQLILLPCFDRELNHRFCEDYQFLLLKQNKEIVEEQLKNLKDPIELYGIEVLKNDFCDFIWIKSFENEHYLYLEDFKSIYVFNESDKTFTDQCIIVDKYSQKIPEMVELKEVVTLYHHQKEDVLLEYLQDHQFISKKVYTKLKKKFLGG